MDWLTVLLVCLLEPLVLGWYAEDILSEIPVSVVSAFQKCNMKSLSQLETKSEGSPFLQYQLSNTKRAISSAEAGTCCSGDESIVRAKVISHGKDTIEAIVVW